ncbi:protein yippee-like At3g08990 isoform X4 [Salvia splendens]|uniref:protein yippee-like At3g08990 isoform X4 n=1 Tax=Salvia splendens TaxID=180675 RepID=UPI001C258DCF|nr:protein yippee-like At3g08990 isoform X4 [Salvia splendens]
MERTKFLVHYEKNQNTSFYLCRHCQTHLALHQELLHKYAANKHALFQDLVNVGLGANYQIVSGQTGAPVSCINCGSNLGSKFVSLSIETSAIKAGRFMIDMTKLFFWKGNQMLCADTEQPVQAV